MSYFEDQEGAWFENGCQGEITDAEPYSEVPVRHRFSQAKKVHSAVGRSRSTLAMSKLEEFAAWAVADGFVREPTKSLYEVLRLRYPGHAPYIFYQRNNAQHATSQSEGTQLVKRWIASR